MIYILTEPCIINKLQIHFKKFYMLFVWIQCNSIAIILNRYELFKIVKHTKGLLI